MYIYRYPVQVCIYVSVCVDYRYVCRLCVRVLTLLFFFNLFGDIFAPGRAELIVIHAQNTHSGVSAQRCKPEFLHIRTCT